jgi:hypothetical protein
MEADYFFKVNESGVSFAGFFTFASLIPHKIIRTILFGVQAQAETLRYAY